MLDSLFALISLRNPWEEPRGGLSPAFDDSGSLQWVCSNGVRCQSQLGKTRPMDKTPNQQKLGRAMRIENNTLSVAFHHGIGLLERLRPLSGVLAFSPPLREQNGSRSWDWHLPCSCRANGIHQAHHADGFQPMPEGASTGT